MRISGEWTQPTVKHVGNGIGSQLVYCTTVTDTNQRTAHILPPRSAEENGTLEINGITGAIPDEVAWHKIGVVRSEQIKQWRGEWIDW